MVADSLWHSRYDRLKGLDRYRQFQTHRRRYVLWNQPNRAVISWRMYFPVPRMASAAVTRGLSMPLRNTARKERQTLMRFIGAKYLTLTGITTPPGDLRYQFSHLTMSRPRNGRIFI